MSRISRKDVEYIAALAQLELDDETKDRFTRELDAILGYVEKLNELDTTGVEPTMHALQRTNVLREDVTGASLSRDVALGNAPSHDGEYFIVPKILEADES